MPANANQEIPKLESLEHHTDSHHQQLKPKPHKTKAKNNPNHPKIKLRTTQTCSCPRPEFCSLQRSFNTAHCFSSRRQHKNASLQPKIQLQPPSESNLNKLRFQAHGKQIHRRAKQKSSGRDNARPAMQETFPDRKNTGGIQKRITPTSVTVQMAREKINATHSAGNKPTPHSRSARFSSHTTKNRISRFFPL